MILVSRGKKIWLEDISLEEAFEKFDASPDSANEHGFYNSRDLLTMFCESDEEGLKQWNHIHPESKLAEGEEPPTVEEARQEREEARKRFEEEKRKKRDPYDIDWEKLVKVCFENDDEESKNMRYRFEEVVKYALRNHNKRYGEGASDVVLFVEYAQEQGLITRKM